MWDVGMAFGAAMAGVGLGWAGSRLPGRGWLAGYLAPLGVILVLAISMRKPEWALHPLLSWVWVGRWRMPLAAGVVSMIFSTLMPRLPQARERRAIGLLVVVAVMYFSVWPAVAMARSRPFLEGLVTRLPPDGICRQSTDYTCGPAAAVTALRRLGLDAGEGELALMAGTSPATGTPADVLVQVLHRRFGGAGLKVELRRFGSLRELREAGLTLVVVKYGMLVDHWLVVLEVTDDAVWVADPASGRVRMSWEAFRDRWRFIGVTLRRDATPSGRNNPLAGEGGGV